MPANVQPIFVKSVRSGLIKISTQQTNPDGAGSTLLWTAGEHGSRLHYLAAIPSGTHVATVVRMFIKSGTNYFIVGEAEMPGYTATSGVAVTSTALLNYTFMPSLDASERYLVLGAGEELYVSLLVSVANAIHIVAQGGDY